MRNENFEQTIDIFKKEEDVIDFINSIYFSDEKTQDDIDMMNLFDHYKDFGYSKRNMIDIIHSYIDSKESNKKLERKGV